MSAKKHFDHFIAAGIDFLFRKKSRGLAVLRIGLALVLALLAGFNLSAEIPYNGSTIKLGWGDTGIHPVFTYGLILIALGIIGLGLRLVWQESKNDERRRVFVIELRGLRDWEGTPLLDQVPETINGRREQILVDMRQKVSDGVIVDPSVALKRILSLRSDLSLREDGMNRSDFTHIVGGLAPVPLTFLAGVIVDDEAPIVFMDWDRHGKRWHPLDEADDGRRFEIDGIAELRAGADDVALAVSASYLVDLQNAQKLNPEMPIVHMRLKDGNPTNYFSSEKQVALGRQFLDVCTQLHSKGTKRIHLFLAASSSLTLRLGTLYDKRNLPPLKVYQYDQGKHQPFSWCVVMPVAGVTDPEVVSI